MMSRLNLGDDVEESHMRNRQWVSAWAYERGLKDNVISKLSRDGKTYFNINGIYLINSIVPNP